MSRVSIAIQETKRYLDQFNADKNINTPLILYHLNQAQGDIAIREDCIETSIVITLADGVGDYDFVFDDGVDGKDIIKRVKSVQYPDTWFKPIFPVDQEFDEIKSVTPSLTFVQYVIIRNGKLSFWGTPGPTDVGKKFILQCYLTEPTIEANNEITTPADFQVPRYFDHALPMYAAANLLPIGSKERAEMFALYDKEVSDKAGVFNHKHNYVRSSRPNW